MASEDAQALMAATAVRISICFNVKRTDISLFPKRGTAQQTEAHKASAWYYFLFG
ncbi:MAG: hypothetical protein AB8B58_12215 [Roseobacter sp.]